MDLPLRLTPPMCSATQHNVGSRLDQPKAPDESQAKVALSFAKYALVWLL